MTAKRHLAALSFVALAAAGLPTFGQEAPPPPPTEPDVATLALQEAKVSFKQGIWPAALAAALKTLETQPANLEALYIAGTSERQTNLLVEAEGHLATLVEAQPLFPLAHFQLGYAQFLRAEGMTRAGQPEPSKAKYGEAAAEFGKELARNPTHAASLSSRAIALGRAGQLEESVTAHEAWIAAFPQKNDPVVSLAATYAGGGRSSEAMATLDRLPDKTEKLVHDASLGVASVYMAKKDWSAAVPFLEKATELDASSSRARALLTESCARAGLVNDAARNLQRLLAMNPTPDEAESVGDAILKNLGGGKSAPASPGVTPPAVLRVPPPRYPKGQDMSTKTEVAVLTLVLADATVGNTVMVPNRIWKDIRTTGFEAAAFDAVKKAKFTAGAKNGQPAEMWVVVPVKFESK